MSWQDCQPVEANVGFDYEIAHGGAEMPTISLFYGVAIMMYFFDEERHRVPHIYARYQNHKAVFSILDGSLLAGEFPVNKLRLVQAWIEIHR